jgi:hypothetical protein
MTMRERDRSTGRRQILVGGSAVLVGAACGSESTTATPATPAGGATGGDASWARGGTAVMAEQYPDPFAAGLIGACTLTCVRTLGPCYAKTIDRRDISEGQPGLPLRLAFLAVDTACKPIPAATVDIWHASSAGIYSADDTAQMCNQGDRDAMEHRFFRGKQTTDARGRVDFDTCFPGWYRGRAVHIHFTVRVGEAEYVTSQLFFASPLITAVHGAHPDYAPRGQPDTPTEKDGIAGVDPSALTLDVQRMDDGVMLAARSIVLRSALGEAICGGAHAQGASSSGATGGQSSVRRNSAMRSASS